MFYSSLKTLRGGLQLLSSRAWMLLVAGVALVGSVAYLWIREAHAGPIAAAGATDDTPVVGAAQLLKAYCGTCHSSGRTGMDLDGPIDFAMVGEDRAAWEEVLAKLRSREMPPPSARTPQPSDTDREFIIAWLEQGLAEHRRSADSARLAVRLLGRREYQNTIRDLFDVAIELPDDFPRDPVGWSRAAQTPVLPAEAVVPVTVAAGRVLAKIDVARLLAEHAPAVADLAINECQAVEATTFDGDADRARRLLAQLARRAYRRPLASAEVDNLAAIFQRGRQERKSLDDAIKAGLHAVLTSPHFLYRMETQTEGGEPQREALELASRLSFFLWSSLPDDELLTLAEHGLLTQELESQVHRMLKDRRARALSEGFATAWLGLGKLPDLSEIDPALLRAMRQETELTVGHVIEQDRNVLEFLEADYTFLNDRLAQHYGIAGVEGPEMRRVSVKETRRGGLLTQASILALTSSGTQTSLVNRGKWVLENLLGTPPPRPSAGLLAALRERGTGSAPGTRRALHEQHRANPSCAVCHGQMDAFGIALENYDAVGAWRTMDGPHPIDAAVRLPGGETLNGPEQLKTYLLGKRELFLRCLSGKLLAYGLGRKLHAPDRAAVEAMSACLEEGDVRFTHILREVIQSEPFQKGTLLAD